MKARLPQGMGGGPQNMQAMLKQAQKMQADMEALQQELDEKEYQINAGGGAVSVTIKGTKQLTAIHLDPDIVDPDDVETLEDTLVAAINEAIRKVESENADAMGKVTGNLNIPGLF